MQSPRDGTIQPRKKTRDAPTVGHYRRPGGAALALSGQGAGMSTAGCSDFVPVVDGTSLRYQGAFGLLGSDRFLMSAVFRLLSLVISSIIAGIPGIAAAQSGSRVPLDWTTVKLDSIGEGLLPTAEYKGKVVLVVNTASLCGFTDQYAGLEALWRRHKAQGFVLLGVPSNDFGGQEPGSKAEIKTFCESTFDVTFPLADKQVVSGANAHPLYKWIAAQAGPLGAPKWNFHKYLVGRDGNLVEWYSAMTGPGSTAIDDAIRKALAAPGA